MRIMVINSFFTFSVISIFFMFIVYCSHMQINNFIHYLFNYVFCLLTCTFSVI